MDQRIHPVVRGTLHLLDRYSNAMAVCGAMLIVTAGCAYSYRLGDDLQTWDEIHYVWLGEHLLDAGIYSLDGEHPSAFRPPGYPFLIAGAMALGAGHVQLRCLNFVLLAATVLLLHRIIARTFGRAAAALLVLMIVGYPILVYLSGALYPQTLAGLLLVALLYVLVLHRDRVWAYIAAGLLLGYLMLTVPAFIFLWPILLLWYLYVGDRKAALRFAAITLLLVLAITLAWSLRNRAALGSFVYISCNSGKNLLFGNSEHATYKSGTTTNIDAYVAEVEAQGYVTHSIEAERYYGSAAKKYILSHPLRCLGLYFGKFIYHFNYYNESATEGVSISLLQRMVLFVTFAPWFALFLLRLAMIPRRRPSAPEVLFIAIYFGSALLHAVYITRVRFRLPVDLLLFAVVANFLILETKRRCGAKDPETLRCSPAVEAAPS